METAVNEGKYNSTTQYNTVQHSTTKKLLVVVADRFYHHQRGGGGLWGAGMAASETLGEGREAMAPIIYVYEPIGPSLLWAPVKLCLRQYPRIQ